ncbi:MAG TPA: adenylosuccinate synthase [Bacteroidales bacterium]|nr:adenylosuccinate synthase [Bacteroidales bacterium]
MNVDVLLGLQWGDEGKGKVVDVLTSQYDVVARFQGGPNAGHTLEFNNIKHVLHTIPSGIFHRDTINIIGNGVVIDPVSLADEIAATEKIGGDISGNLFISRKAHLILPTHKLMDAALEKSKGSNKIGSTLKGIGPAYTDKVARNGLRIGDIESPDFVSKFNILRDQHGFILKNLGFEIDSEAEIAWFRAIEAIKRFRFIDSEYAVNDWLAQGKTMLAEGAQGTLLDVDFGSYPFVTSSNTCSAGVCTGLGISPRNVGNVFGVFKAYCTRVGSGPFPTELHNETGELMRSRGHEFGSTTGRPRRCGWLDLVALKYSIMINGVSELFMMKADVLDEFDTIRICTGYKVDGLISDHIPYDITKTIEPVYRELPGWKTPIDSLKDVEAIPAELIQYIDFIQKETGVKISLLSTGPDRTQTLRLK